MKTKVKIIVVLSMITFATSAKQRESNTGKFHFLTLKQALMGNDINSVQLKHFLVSENYFSVPGFSEDYSWDEDSADWPHVSNTTYSYDEVGRITEEIVQDAETDYYLPGNSYEYDKFGNITLEVAYVRGVDEWIAISGDTSSVYQYNTNG
jgi:YD repeat-containing protein